MSVQGPTFIPHSIREHRLWQELLPFLKVEYPSKGDSKSRRFRLEIKRLPLDLAIEALAIETRCADCRAVIHPVRVRKAPGNRRSEKVGHGYYLGLACPLSVSVGCSRGAAVRDEYRAVQRARDAFEALQAGGEP